MLSAPVLAAPLRYCLPGHRGSSWLTGRIWTPPDVSKEVNDRRIDQDRMQSYIRPVVSDHAPGHHGYPRTEGQSLNSDLCGQACYRPRSAPVQTGHAMIINPR